MKMTEPGRLRAETQGFWEDPAGLIFTNHCDGPFGADEFTDAAALAAIVIDHDLPRVRISGDT